LLIQQEVRFLLTVNKDSQLNLQVETKLFTKGENELVDKNWNPGTSADIIDKDKKVVIVVVNKLMKPEPKAYQDAKGMVTADYQSFLEKQWLSELKQKYAVTIDQSVLSTVK
jgi:peptidyl-prolyl cis-trans isomerase SurA